MPASWQGAVLIAATVLNGLMAGLYFAFSIAVIPGLRQCDDRSFLSAMQAVNRTILNGFFGLAFAGSLLLPLVAGALQLAGDGGAVVAWTAAAFVLYGVTLVITFGVNVPLNDALDKAPEADAAAARERFEVRWTRWNHARAVLCTAALGCLAWALVLQGDA